MDAEQFWQYSLSLYRREDVRAALLALQDQHGLDVNMLLLCCWQWHLGNPLDQDTLVHLETHLRPWRQSVTVPLRQVRRALKTDSRLRHGERAEKLRASVLEHELVSERIAQSLLVDQLPKVEPGSPAKQGVLLQSLETYYRVSDSPGDGGGTLLATIVSGARTLAQ